MTDIPYFTKIFLEKREAHLQNPVCMSKTRQAFTKAALISAGAASVAELALMGLAFGNDSKLMENARHAVDKKLSAPK